MGGTFGKHGSWVVDHTMDDIPLHAMTGDLRHGSIATLTGGSSVPDYKDDPTRVLETEAERKARKRSHWVAYTTMFVMSMGFSIVLSGVWPYLQELKPDVTKEALGWVVAANPLGQMVASPLLGFWGNKAGSIRMACIVTVIVFIFGNAMYCVLNVFAGMGDNAPYYAMIVSRFIVGVSSANVTLCRSYLAGSTTLKERTVGIAIIAASQALGFVIGPAIQSIVTIAIPEPVDTGSDWFLWDKFTAAGWVAALLGFINLVLLTPCIFQEYNIAEKERAMMKSNQSAANIKLPKPDYLSLSAILFGFFITLFIYVLLETLAVPFVTDQYAWTEDKAMIVVGVALSVGGLLSIFMFGLGGYLSKRYDERMVMIIVGFIPLIVGTFLFLPWGPGSIQIRVCENETTTTEMPITTTTPMTIRLADVGLLSGGADIPENCSPGCPEEQEWCEYTPLLPIPQLAVAYIVVILGYPVAQSLAQALFSKMLGPKPQGFWMGMLTAVGSFSRIMGPIFVSYVYTVLGTRWTFGILTGAMVLAVLVLIIAYPRIVPMKIPSLEEARGYDGPAANEKH